jgi:hypothetical protein
MGMQHAEWTWTCSMQNAECPPINLQFPINNYQLHARESTHGGCINICMGVLVLIFRYNQTIHHGALSSRSGVFAHATRHVRVWCLSVSVYYCCC